MFALFEEFIPGKGFVAISIAISIIHSQNYP